MGRFQEWRERQRLASDLAAKVLGTQPYFESGRQGEMVHPLRAWLAQAEGGLGPEQSVTLELRYRLAAALRATGAVAEAAEQAGVVVAARGTLGTSQVLLQAWVLYAGALDNLGRHGEAADAWGELGELVAKDVDRGDFLRLVRSQRAAALCHAERFVEAEQESRRLIESAGPTSGAAATSTRLSGLILASVALMGQGRAAEAESAARHGLVEAGSQTTAAAEANIFVLNLNLAAAISAQGHHAEAIDLAFSTPRPTTVNPEAGAAMAITTARAFLALGRREEATAALQRAIPATAQYFGPDHIRNRELRTLLAQADPAAV